MVLPEKKSLTFNGQKIEKNRLKPERWQENVKTWRPSEEVF